MEVSPAYPSPEYKSDPGEKFMDYFKQEVHKACFQSSPQDQISF
jgi:hypothetical protein